MIVEPITCPTCSGTGLLTEISEDARRRFLEGIWQWEALRNKSNAELAGVLSEVENYLRNRDLLPIVFNFLQEVWWRLHAAEEPVGETRRKIEALSDDPEWLESE